MTTMIVSPETGATGAEAIKRRYGSVLGAAVNQSVGLASCDIIDIRDYFAIAVKPSAGITQLSVYASPDKTAANFVLVDSIGTAGVVSTPASKWTVLDPTKIAPFGYLKFIPNADGTVDVVGKS